MVLQKRSEYGFHGYQIPTMPTGCRSARKKRAIRYSVINTANLCAIDLLATVAGELLLEKEDAAATVITPQQLQHDDKRPVKVEPCNQGNCDKAAPLIQYQKRLPHKYMFKEATSRASSPSPAFLGAVATAAAARGDTKPGPLFRHSPAQGSSASPKLEKEEVAAASIPIWINNNTSNNSGNVKGSSDQGNMENKAATGKESMDVDIKPPAPPLASSDSSVEVPATYCSPRNNFMRRSSSIPRIHDKSMMDHDGCDKDAGDDDENSSACTHPSTVSPRAATASSAFRPQRIGDRRIRKLLSPRFWKVGPTHLKEGEFCDRDMFRSKKLSYTRHNTQRSSFKRRKLFQRNSFSSPSAGIATKTISKLSSDYNNKSIKGEQAGNETSSSITSPKMSFKSEGYQVKLKIKSFKVPELFIEMPESATVGALKRAVLETVTTMLGNGLKVGVIYQGRKVRDDSRTLSQAGIGGGEMLDSLNFSLEPVASSGGASSSALLQNTPGSSSCRAEAPLPLEEQCRSPRPLAVRLPDFRCDNTKNVVKPDARELPQQQQGQGQGQGQPKVVGLGSPSNKALAVSSDCHADASGAIVPISSTLLSKALVPVNPSPPLSSSELAVAVVPVSNKSTRRPETGQRRIRRPFSVAEVEALVQAVEKLGTGRWRDVKLQAFENAKHRTYVDLKDKWKTLVHTARISPQQRRGEPVPQVLLDRVLVAHAHWSQHQARLQPSKQAGNTPGGSGTAHPQQQPNNSCLAAGLLLPPPPMLEQQPQPAAALI